MGIGVKELLIILAVALLIFGTKKLKNLGSDLGSAVKGFKQAMNEGEKDPPKPEQLTSEQKDAEFHAESNDPAKSHKT